MKKLWETIKTNKKARFFLAAFAVVVIGICVCFFSGQITIRDGEIALSGGIGPTVYYGEAQFIRGGEVTVDVKLSDLQGDYPAASFQIDFDKNKLEFIGIRQGNIVITNTKTGDTAIPEWQFNKDTANNKGTISTMYLDMTAENNPISGNALSADADVLFRLVFRVKDSCNDGETLTLTTSQATFAAIDEKDSIAVYKNNINVPAGSFTVVLP